MTAPSPRPEPCPPLIYDQLCDDFQSGRVPVDYRTPAPLDTSLPIEATQTVQETP